MFLLQQKLKSNIHIFSTIHCLEAVPDLTLSLCKRFDLELYLHFTTGRDFLYYFKFDFWFWKTCFLYRWSYKLPGIQRGKIHIPENYQHCRIISMLNLFVYLEQILWNGWGFKTWPVFSPFRNQIQDLRSISTVWWSVDQWYRLDFTVTE